MVATILMKDKGFTLTELIIVIAIISILAAIAIPAYVGQQKRAARTEAFSNLETLRLLEEQYFAENGRYTVSLGDPGKDNDNVAIIQSVLPGFRPGTRLSFSYWIEQNINLNGEALTPCFRASAAGNTGTRVDGEVYRIDCNNNRNF